MQSATRDQNVGKIAIAYTVWSNKKGGGKLIVKEVFKMIKKSNHLNRLVTLSPLTEMARNFHLRNGAEEIQSMKKHKTLSINYKINLDKSVSFTSSPICFLIYPESLLQFHPIYLML